MAKKTTKKEKFTMLLNMSEVQANAELVEFIEHELELLDRKSNAPTKETEKDKRENAIREAIVDFLNEHGESRYTITEIINAVPECVDETSGCPLSNQKVSGLIKPLLGTKIQRIEDKRKTYFAAL